MEKKHVTIWVFSCCLYSDSKNCFHANPDCGAQSTPSDTVGISLSLGGVINSTYSWLLKCLHRSCDFFHTPCRYDYVKTAIPWKGFFTFHAGHSGETIAKQTGISTSSGHQQGQLGILWICHTWEPWTYCAEWFLHCSFCQELVVSPLYSTIWETFLSTFLALYDQSLVLLCGMVIYHIKYTAQHVMKQRSPSIKLASTISILPHLG